MLGFLIFLLLLYIYKKSAANCILLICITYPTLCLFIVSKFNVAYAISLIAFTILIIKYKKYASQIKNYPFGIASFIAVFSYIGTFLSERTPHITFLITALAQFILPLLLWINKDKLSLKQIQKYYRIYVILLVFYALFEAFSHSNPIMDFLNNSGWISTPKQPINYVRFGLYRAQSITYWSTAFGTLCATTLLYFLHSYYKQILKPTTSFYVLCSLISFGIMIQGSRTIIAMTCIMLLSIIHYMSKELRKFIPFFLIGGLAFIIFSTYLDKIITAFIDPDSISGSTTEMREMQLETTLLFFEQNPIWGNGLQYVSEAMKINPQLLGAESILFSTLIDRGIVGLICLILYALFVLVALIRNHHYSLCIIAIAFFWAKYNSLLPSLSETYILLPLILLMDLDYRKK